MEAALERVFYWCTWLTCPGLPSAASTMHGGQAPSRSPGNRATVPPRRPHAAATSRSGATFPPARRPGGLRSTDRYGGSSATRKIIAASGYRPRSLEEVSSGLGQPLAVDVDVDLLVVEGDQAGDGQQLAGRERVGPREILVTLAHPV